MTYNNPGSDNLKVKISVEMIKDFFSSLPQNDLTLGVSEKKQRADAALEYLDSLFGDSCASDSIDDPEFCGPKPVIPGFSYQGRN
jgi:hypothetical protein